MLFCESVEHPEDERSSWLDRACAGDRQLRAAVERLASVGEIATGVAEGPFSANRGDRRVSDFDISNRREVVYISQETSSVMFWRRGQSWPLAALLPEDQPLTLGAPVSFGDRGEIVCRARLPIPGFHPIGLILTPRPGASADVTGDCATDAADLAVLLQDWGMQDSPADLDFDGVVGPADLAWMLADWGR